jgi:hypothetical protein
VKPGKEILVSMASTGDEDQFGEQPIMFEGDALDFEAGDDTEDETVVVEPPPPVRQAMPPKMRRAWNKQLEAGESSTCEL